MRKNLPNPDHRRAFPRSITSLLKTAFMLLTSMLLWNSDTYAQSGERCFTSSVYPQVYAKSVWSTTGDTVTIRTTLSREFVDNTYGTSIIGWPGTHKFSDLTGSDFLQIALFNNVNTKILEFKMDYFTASAAAPSGFKSLGVTGGDGGMVTGSAANVYGVTTSMDVNFNTFGYVLTTNSPVTDSNYTANPTYPNWIFSVWYEVKVNKNAFGASGFFQPSVTGVHASPSKVGTNSVAVTPDTCPLASIGNQVWSDSNQNGIQDAGEPGVAGVTVSLFDCATGTLRSSTTTSSSGSYHFSNLPIESSYYLIFDPSTLPAGFAFTQQNQGSNDALDSDANPTTGQTPCEYLTANENNTFYDAGIYNPNVASIGNFVWNDIDEDGIQDANEPGAAGVTVELYTCTRTFVGTTTTNTNGFYGFSNLAPGSYFIKFILPSSATGFSPKNVGSNGAIDSDADPLNGETACEALVAGENNSTYDVGLIFPVAGELCFIAPTMPNIAFAKSEWSSSGDTITIRTSLSRTFVDNTYGTTRIGWPGSHTFNDLVGSDKLQLALFDNTNTRILEFEIDYISASAAAPSGFKCLGVTGGEGSMVFGSAANVFGATTSIDVNLNTFGYVLTTNSPSTDSSYSANPTYPNWIYTVWYEVKVRKSAFLNGFSYPDITDVHASPSKVGSNSVIVDPGPCPVASLGDRVWRDNNVNGLQDAGEPGVAGVTVRLFNCASGTQVATTTTDANGNYLFSNLEVENSYYVVFDLASFPTGLSLTGQNQGSNDAADSDANPTTGQTACEYLTAGENNTSYDAGLYDATVASIGNFVWDDRDEDGIQDTSEPGINGVTVELYTCAGTLVSSTTTAAGGFYFFPNLAPGSYYVKFTPPAGARFTTKNAGSNNAVDSDADPVTGQTACENLVAGEINTSYDAGIVVPVEGERCFISPSLPNTAFAKSVWSSSGDTITIRTSLSRTFVDNTYGTTRIGWPGSHTFNDLVGSDKLQLALFDNNNTRILEFEIDYISASSTVPSGFKCLGVTGGEGSMVFGSATNVFGATTSIDVNFNTFGYVLTTNSPATDTNYTTNPTYPNWIYTVWYEVKVRKSAFLNGFAFPDITDVHASPSKVGSNSVLVDPGPCPVGSIGDFVWNDQNQNGIQDAGEPGVPGVTVRLYNCLSNTPIATTVTNANGNYLFPNLTVDVSYYVEFDLSTAPAGALFTSKDTGSDNSKDSDADPSTGRTICENITINENNLTYDAGIYIPFASIGDFVWEDLDGDGVQDSGEPGISGVTVRLYTCAGVLAATTTTNANGAYLFSNIPPGNYFVEFVAPSGYVVTAKDQGGNDSADSDADPVTGRTACENLTANENNTTYDAGLYRPASLGDFMWNDLNGDGIQDPGEPGISGATVRLYTCAGVLVATTTTDANGAYLFSNLPPASYYVEFVAPSGFVFGAANQGGDDAKDSDANPANGRTACETLASGENNTTYDAGLYQPASLGDFMWNDLDGDGIQDPGEPGISGATVRLYTCAGVLVATTTTDVNGAYLFSGIAPGSYYVEFAAPSGYVFSAANQGADDSQDSDANPANGRTPCETLTSGENNTTYDAGLYQPASIGNFVWNDLDGDGIQDPGEPGISGATVRLYTCAGVLVATTTTDVNGAYLFSNIAPGSYYVEFVAPSGYVFTSPNQGGDDNTDSDPNPSNGRTACETLTSGENNTTYDAGLYVPASLGDFVWNDIDGDGIQDPGEPGINNVTVRLYTCAGTLVSTTTTNANGGYLFSNLAPGSYYVEFTAPSGFVFTPQNQGADDSKDSDANPTNGRTSCETLASGENNTTYDAGLYQPARIGDFVWEDLDGDGIQDPGEPGVPGASVSLYNCAGVLIATTTTNANGGYEFTGIPPGNYYVQFNLPSGYNWAPQNAGGNTSLDSDANPANGQSACITVNSGDNNTTIDAGINCIAPVAPTLSITQPTCLVATGTITITSPIGAGLTYSLNGVNYQSSNVFSGLAPGAYTVRVKNSINCVSATTSAVINIQPPTPLSPIMSVTQPDCNIPAGSITILSPIGAGITYSINGVNYQAGTSFSNLAAGTYNVTAQNTQGCVSAPSTITINPQPATPPAPVVTITQPNCSTSTGTISITSPIGSGLTYSLNGVNYQAGTSFSNLSPGTYNVTVKNAAGCISNPTPAVINPQPATPSAPTVNITQPDCFTATGTITVTSPIGTGLNYSINGVNYQSSTTFSNLAPGTYNVTAKNAAGCISAPTPATVNPQPATPAAPSVSVTQPDCITATGTIQINSPHGVGLTYSINGVNYQSGTTFSNLAPGTYSVTVKNASGCISAPTTVTVNPQPATPPAPTVNFTQPTCIVPTGTITVISPIGTGLTYSINGVNYQSSTTFSGLAPGTYSVTAKNAAGCISTPTPATVNPQPATPPSPTLSITQPDCITSTGTITVLSPLGTGITYSINGSNYQSSTTFSGIAPGTYNVTAKNAAGCISVNSPATVNPQPATPPAPTVNITQPDCITSTGTITVISPIGTGLTYSINGVHFQSSTTFSNLAPGTYNVTVKNAAGCISAATPATVNPQPATPPAPSVNITQPTCLAPTGTITVISPIGTGLTYSINGVNYQSSTTFSGLAPGTYNVTAKNAAGCISAPTPATVNPQPSTPPAPTVNITQPDCITSTGTITVISPIGTGLTYSINGVQFQSSTTFSNLAPGTYNVTVKNAAGCISAATPATVNPQPANPPAPTVNITQPDCFTATGTITVTSPIGTGLTYSINGVNYQSSTTFSGLAPGTYNVTAKNAAGCISAPTPATVNPQPATPPAPSVNITQPDCITPTGTITVLTPLGTGLTYSINGVNYQSSTTFSGLAPGTYNVTAKNAAGCISAPTPATVNPQPATPPAPTVNITQPDCFTATGTITVTSPIGTGLTYSINGVNYQSSTTFSNLAPGTYNVTAKNAAGCISAPTPATVNPQPAAPPAPTVNVTQPTCLTPTGTISVTSPTGTGLTYSINGVNYQSSTTFSGLAPGAYNVTVKNAAGCISAPTPAVVNPQPASPAAPTVNITQPTCLTSTGTITVTAPTGAGFTYSINGVNYQSSTTFSGLAPGTYSVTAKNAAGCISAPTPATIDPAPVTPPAPTVTITQPTCFIATGTITVTGPTGTGFTYSINGVNYQSSTTFSNLAPGTYTVTAKSPNNCVSPGTTAVVLPPPTSCGAGIFPTQTTCATFKDGTASPLASLCYTKRQGTVSNVTPGVFFYFTSIVAPSTSFTVDIKQTAPVGFQTFAVHQDNQITIWNRFCGRIAGGYTTTRGQAQIMVTNAVVGQQYIIAVKYDAKTLIGNPVVGSPSPVFNFWTELNSSPAAGSQTSITMSPNCSGARAEDGYVNNSISAFPNPTSDLVNLNYHMTEGGDVDIRVFNMSGQLVMDRLISHDSPGDYKTELQLHQLGLPGGLYVIQVIRRNDVIDHIRIVLND